MDWVRKGLEKKKAFKAMCQQGNRSPEECLAIRDRYIYTSREPLEDVLAIYQDKKPGAAAHCFY